MGVAWLAEEVGESSPRAIRRGTRDEQLHELGDEGWPGWRRSPISLDLTLEERFARYAGGCPYCGAAPGAAAAVPSNQRTGVSELALRGVSTQVG